MTEYKDKLCYEGLEEAAKGLGVHKDTVRYYLESGRLTFFKTGRSLLIPVGQLQEKTLPGWPDVKKRKRRPGRPPNLKPRAVSTRPSVSGPPL